MNESTFQGNGKVTYVPVIVNGKQAKQNNADRIRSMADEELAELLCGYQCNTCDFDGFCDETDKCEEEIIEWLKQECES